MNSREKIHEFVNMARHPEAKDLDEALEMETKYGDCLYECQMVNYGGDSIHYAKMTKLEYFKKSLEIHNVYLDLDNLDFSILATRKPRLANLKIIDVLGRPITAFDVCWALNKRDFRLRNFTANQIGIFYNTGNDGKDSCWIKFETIKQDGTHTTPDQWGVKICNQLAILMYSNEEIIEIAKLLSRE